MSLQQIDDGPKPPLAFVSYAHEGQSHSDWVRDLAARLREVGVDTRLDQWHLPPGGNLSNFMTSSVRESDFVLIVCTPKYAEKASADVGGVGFEGSIIAGSILTQPDNQKKFIPLLRSGTPAESIPAFLWNRVHVDFTNDREFQASVERLSRHILGRPANIPPPVGPSPFKPSSENQAQLQSRPKHWVLVAGTGDTDKLKSDLLHLSQGVGHELAKKGLGLVCGGWPGVDRVVSESFASTLQEQGLPLENFLVQVVEQSWRPVFQAGSVIPVPNGEAEYIESVKRADAAILIGGLGGTFQTGDYMRIAGKPVFPIVQSGGDAKQFFDRMCQKWYEGCIPNVSKARYMQLAQKSDSVITLVMDLLKRWSESQFSG
jgi:predicted Rossmann-fold nucleotide-binding protein